MAIMHATPSGRVVSRIPIAPPLLESATVTVGGLLHTFTCFVVERGLYGATAPTRESE